MTNDIPEQTVYVDTFTNGVLNPNKKMLGPVIDGGYIVVNTTPGCWGPMITPSLQGGHEVTEPVYVDGAEVGDAIAIELCSIQVTSLATASGSDEPVEEHYISDPYVDGKCPQCGKVNPETQMKETGPDTVRCVYCGANVTPFRLANGYTIAFGNEKYLGVTLPKEAAYKVGEEGYNNMKTPKNSNQNPVVSLAPHDISGVVARSRPFLGQLGTTPSRAFPDSHNAGDFGQALIDAPHEYGITKKQLEERTDGHMDINRVREGAVLICPVKTPGGGIYVGDMHAMQGNGEIAGHTTDVSGIAVLQVRVLKNTDIEGPILLPVKEDLPYNAKPLTENEKQEALQISRDYGLNNIEEAAPVSFIGTGATLNEATDNGLKRSATLLGLSVPEVMNRATITGSIDIGRYPGVVTVTFLVPLTLLSKAGIYDLVVKKYL